MAGFGPQTAFSRTEAMTVSAHSKSSPFTLSDYPQAVTDHAVFVLNWLLAKGYEAEAGSKRIALIAPHRRTVIKIPRCDRGIADNHREVRAFRLHQQGRSDVPIASCRLFYADPLVGLPLLMMRYVSQADLDPKDLPPWSYTVDCFQIGFDRLNRLVAYDL